MFPAPETTRLAEGDTPAALAERLVGQIWDDLCVWNAYDFTPTSSGLVPRVTAIRWSLRSATVLILLSA